MESNQLNCLHQIAPEPSWVQVFAFLGLALGHYTQFHSLTYQALLLPCAALLLPLVEENARKKKRWNLSPARV
jgi:hypothetical protein